MYPEYMMQDASEIVQYDTAGIPLYIREAKLSSYPDMQALCHWHEDLEFIRIKSGKMNYFINGRKLLLEKDSGKPQPGVSFFFRRFPGRNFRARLSRSNR